MSSSGSVSTSNSQGNRFQMDMTPAEFAALRPFIADQTQFLGQGGPQFGGPNVAGLGGTEQFNLNQIQNMAFGQNPLSRSSDQQLLETIQGRFASPQSNPFLQGTIDAAVRPIMQNFQDQELMDRSGFTRAGHKIQNSSPFATARARAIEGTSRAVGDVSSQIANANLQAERTRQLQATQQAQANSIARFQVAQGALEASALPRMIQDLGIQRGIEEFNRRVALMRDALQIGAGLTQPTLGSFGTDESESVAVSGSVSGGYGG